jgi:hypothetical protein
MDDISTDHMKRRNKLELRRRQSFKLTLPEIITVWGYPLCVLTFFSTSVALLSQNVRKQSFHAEFLQVVMHLSYIAETGENNGAI